MRWEQRISEFRLDKTCEERLMAAPYRELVGRHVGSFEGGRRMGQDVV